MNLIHTKISTTKKLVPVLVPKLFQFRIMNTFTLKAQFKKFRLISTSSSKSQEVTQHCGDSSEDGGNGEQRCRPDFFSVSVVVTTERFRSRLIHKITTLEIKTTNTSKGSKKVFTRKRCQYEKRYETNRYSYHYFRTK